MDTTTVDAATGPCKLDHQAALTDSLISFEPDVLRPTLDSLLAELSAGHITVRCCRVTLTPGGVLISGDVTPD